MLPGSWKEGELRGEPEMGKERRVGLRKRIERFFFDCKIMRDLGVGGK